MSLGLSIPQPMVATVRSFRLDPSFSASSERFHFVVAHRLALCASCGLLSARPLRFSYCRHHRLWDNNF